MSFETGPRDVSERDPPDGGRSARSAVKAALARGRKGGRRRKLTEDDLAVARAMLKDPNIPVAQVAKRMGVSRTTFYAYFPGARRRGAET